MIQLNLISYYNTTQETSFFEKSYTICERETTPRSCSKKSELSISLDQ